MASSWSDPQVIVGVAGVVVTFLAAAAATVVSVLLYRANQRSAQGALLSAKATAAASELAATIQKEAKRLQRNRQDWLLERAENRLRLWTNISVSGVAAIAMAEARRYPPDWQEQEVLEVPDAKFVQALLNVTKRFADLQPTNQTTLRGAFARGGTEERDALTLRLFHGEAASALEETLRLRSMTPWNL